MDTSKLVAALDAAIAKPRPPEEKIFLRLLREVWQVDCTVAPYDVFFRMMNREIPYFLTFMALDSGDEREEHQLINDWIRSSLNPSALNLGALMGEVNRLRATVGY